MQVRTLRALLKAKGISQSEIARRIGVSRQAVSLWLRQDGEVNVHGRNLLRVGQALGVRADELAQPLPCLEPENHARMRASLLWDGLYSDLDDFAIAVNRWEPSAVGRLVEVYGLFVAEKSLGGAVWKRFGHYERHIHPVRRQQCKRLVLWHNNQKAA